MPEPVTRRPEASPHPANPREIAQALQIQLAFGRELAGGAPLAAASHHTLQAAAWEDADDPGKPGEQKWVPMIKGLTWFYRPDGLMYFTTSMLADKRVNEHANKAFTYAQWREAGWIYEETRIEPAKILPKAVPVAKNYEETTFGIEQELKVTKLRTKGRGDVGRVSKGGTDLVLFGTDMQVKRPDGKLEPDTYTLEFKTTPCEITDVQGRKDRLAAGKVLVDEIKRAEATEDGLMAPVTSGELALSFTGQLQLLPPKTRTDEMIFGNQLTVGVSNRELLEAAGSKRGKAELGGIGVQALMAEARWAPAPRVEVLRKHFADAHETEEGFTPHAAAAYALLAALAEFMARAYRTEAIRRKLVGGNRVTSEHAKQGPSIDWTNPIVKNSFGVLPKTPPLTWLVTLKGPWRTVVKSALTPQAPGSTEGAEEYAEAVGLILSGSMIAGHKPPAFLIKDSVGSAFEFRSPTLEQSENFQPNTTR